MNALAALALIATAQGLYGPVGPIKPPTGPIKPPKYVDFPVALIANPDFEQADNGWDASGSYYYDSGTGEVIPGGQGEWTIGSAHSGKGYYDFGLSSSYGDDSQYSSVYQPLTKGTLGSQITTATVWARSYYQALIVTLTYSDGTQSVGSYDVFTDGGAYQRVDFKALIKPTKTVVGVEFGVVGSHDCSDLSIDDISLIKVVRTYL